MYLGTSRGIEYFRPAKKRGVTRTGWDKRGRYTEPSCLQLASAAGRKGAGRGRCSAVPCVLRPCCTIETLTHQHNSALPCTILTIALPQVIHQQSIINQRQAAGPDRVIQYGVPNRLGKRVGELKSCVTSSSLSFSLRVAALFRAAPIPACQPVSLSDQLHCGRIRCCPSKTPSLHPSLRCRSFWPRHGTPYGQASWSLRMDDNQVVCIQPKSISAGAKSSLSCINLRLYTRSAVERQR